MLKSDLSELTAETVGTRPGLHGQTLISTGHADLDRLLGGGLPLGCLLLVLEDAWTPHGTTLMKCFAAEGAAWGHRLLWACGGAGAGVKLPKLVVGKSAEEVRSAHGGVPSCRMTWRPALADSIKFQGSLVAVSLPVHMPIHLRDDQKQEVEAGSSNCTICSASNDLSAACRAIWGLTRAGSSL